MYTSMIYTGMRYKCTNALTYLYTNSAVCNIVLHIIHL